MFSYRAYNYCIHSPFAFPELVVEKNSPDVIVQVGKIDRVPTTSELDGWCFHANAREAFFYWPDVGTIAVRDGCQILVEPLSHADERVIRLVILGSAMAAILHQRGHLVLHASAVIREGRAIGFVGRRGWGKSTMAAALHAQGCALVADDVLAVKMNESSQPMVVPAFPQLKLWPESAACLGIDPDSLPHIEPHIEKRARSAREGFPNGLLPLDRIYVLAADDEQKIEVLPEQTAFIELVRHLHSAASSIMEHTHTAGEHLVLCAQLVRAVPVYRMSRPASLALLPQLARLVLAHESR